MGRINLYCGALQPSGTFRGLRWDPEISPQGGSWRFWPILLSTLCTISRSQRNGLIGAEIQFRITKPKSGCTQYVFPSEGCECGRKKFPTLWSTTLDTDNRSFHDDNLNRAYRAQDEQVNHENGCASLIECASSLQRCIPRPRGSARIV